MIKLTPGQYEKAWPLLRTVAINTLYVEAVIGQKVDGTVYADSVENPTVFYVAHPYGMSLLFGSTNNESFNRALTAHLLNGSGVRDRYEWLQAYPGQWDEKLKVLLGDRLIPKNAPVHSGGDASSRELAASLEEEGRVLENVRVNFTFHEDKYRKAAGKRRLNAQEIVPITYEMAQSIQGAVVPGGFWRMDGQASAEHAGYCLLVNGEIASTAFAAYHTDTQLEIGIETAEAHRGRGYAFQVCAALIDYCLERGLEPVWSCRRENEGSYNLAQSLGFEPTRTFPYYRLPV